MKTNLLALYLVTTCLSIFLFSSCDSDDENQEAAPDFSINSTGEMDVIAFHDNGWIKEGVKKDGLGNTVMIFEYHDNGYIKSCKVYEPWPNHYLYAELERDEYNLPVSSRYFYPDGTDQMNITYKEGVISSKVIVTEDGNIAEFFFEDGQLSGIEQFEANTNNSIKVWYDYDAGHKTIEFMNSGSIENEVQLPVSDELGCGINTNEDMMLTNFLKNETIKEENVFKSFSTSLVWESELDPHKIIPAPVVYGKWSGPRTRDNDTRFVSESDIYRSVAEQYPFAESKILVSGFNAIKESYYIYPELSTREELGDLLEQDHADFNRRYGDEFYHEQFYGTYQLNVGVLRNLPSDQQVRSAIETIARKYMSYLISGNDDDKLTSDEQDMLSKVFFEMKVHSPALDNINGEVILSHKNYLAAEKKIEEAADVIVQKVFKKYSTIALNP